MFLELKYQTSTGARSPLCYMKVDPTTGEPKPLVGTRTGRRRSFASILTSGATSSEVFPLEFSPGGNPWASEADWNINLQAKTIKSLPGGTSTNCPQCPVGARCRSQRRQLEETRELVATPGATSSTKAHKKAIYHDFTDTGQGFVQTSI